MALNWLKAKIRKWLGIHDHAIAIDAISARLAEVQLHPALSIPALQGFEVDG